MEAFGGGEGGWRGGRRDGCSTGTDVHVFLFHYEFSPRPYRGASRTAQWPKSGKRKSDKRTVLATRTVPSAVPSFRRVTSSKVPSRYWCR